MLDHVEKNLRVRGCANADSQIFMCEVGCLQSVLLAAGHQIEARYLRLGELTRGLVLLRTG